MDKSVNAVQRMFSRRSFLRCAAALPWMFGAAQARAYTHTRAHIVILGGGTAGLAISAQLARLLSGARITLVEPANEHHYQPGWPLVLCGLSSVSETKTPNQQHVALGVRWLQSWAQAIDPLQNRVYTADQRVLEYDFLIVALGCEADFAAIEGMHPELLGHEGLFSIYGGARSARKGYHLLQQAHEMADATMLFTAPDTPIKCLGGPVKAALISDFMLRRQRLRARMQLHYFSGSACLLPQPQFARLAEHFLQERAIEVHPAFVLKGIDPGYRAAYFATPGGGIERVAYDLLHIVPPMHAPWLLAHSGLAWDEGPYAAGGWLKVDPHTLQHPDYFNIFGIGDVVGTPYGKTVSTLRYHLSTVTENLLALLHGQEPRPLFNGYTSCPLYTEIGRAVRMAFDYSRESAPDPFISPANMDTRIAWWQQVHLFRLLYLNLLKGRMA